MSFRIERINSEMQRSLSDIITYRLKDPRVSAMVSILKVDAAKDLKTAKVYISIYGDKESKEETLAALNHCAGFIKRELAQDFKAIHTVPELTFKLDTTEEYAKRIDAIIDEINKKN